MTLRPSLLCRALRFFRSIVVVSGNVLGVMMTMVIAFLVGMW